jgi:hypothetical protein
MGSTMKTIWRGFAAGSAVGLLAGCLNVTPPPADAAPRTVQVNFNVAQTPSAASNFSRGAISGNPQRMGFFYSVNPDCTSDGLVRMDVKSPPKHGSVAFVNADDYTSFPASSDSHECNKKKSRGVQVVYTANSDFTGVDQFSVQGIGPRGKLLLADYTVTVVAPKP